MRKAGPAKVRLFKNSPAVLEAPRGKEDRTVLMPPYIKYRHSVPAMEEHLAARLRVPDVA